MSNSKFNKVCHKYEIILIRMDNNLKYDKKTKSDISYVRLLQQNI